MISPDPHLGFGSTERDIDRHYDPKVIVCDNVWWCEGYCETNQEIAMGLCEKCLERWMIEKEEE